MQRLKDEKFTSLLAKLSCKWVWSVTTQSVWKSPPKKIQFSILTFFGKSNFPKCTFFEIHIFRNSHFLKFTFFKFPFYEIHTFQNKYSFDIRTFYIERNITRFACNVIKWDYLCNFQTPFFERVKCCCSGNYSE